MSITTSLLQGLQLMLMGMGFVFVFLSLLIAIVTLMSKILVSPTPPDTVAANSSNALSDPELVSVITSAVHTYRKQQQNSKRNT